MQRRMQDASEGNRRKHELQQKRRSGKQSWKQRLRRALSAWKGHAKPNHKRRVWKPAPWLEDPLAKAPFHQKSAMAQAHISRLTASLANPSEMDEARASVACTSQNVPFGAQHRENRCLTQSASAPDAGALSDHHLWVGRPNKTLLVHDATMVREEAQ